MWFAGSLVAGGHHINTKFWVNDVFMVFFFGLAAKEVPLTTPLPSPLALPLPLQSYLAILPSTLPYYLTLPRYFATLPCLAFLRPSTTSSAPIRPFRASPHPTPPGHRGMLTRRIAQPSTQGPLTPNRNPWRCHRPNRCLSPRVARTIRAHTPPHSPTCVALSCSCLLSCGPSNDGSVPHVIAPTHPHPSACNILSMLCISTSPRVTCSCWLLGTPLIALPTQTSADRFSSYLRSTSEHLTVTIRTPQPLLASGSQATTAATPAAVAALRAVAAAAAMGALSSIIASLILRRRQHRSTSGS